MTLRIATGRPFFKAATNEAIASYLFSNDVKMQDSFKITLNFNFVRNYIRKIKLNFD